MEKGKEEKTKFSKMLPSNQIITACRIELRVQEMTMNEKSTMIGLILEPDFGNEQVWDSYWLPGHTRNNGNDLETQGTKNMFKSSGSSDLVKLA